LLVVFQKPIKILIVHGKEVSKPRGASQRAPN
jgi:hypothetical protein